MIYLDNAATTWPKPASVVEAMVRFMTEIGANPGRSSHQLSCDSARIVNETREIVSTLFNNIDPLRVVFCSNVTEALNLSLCGILNPGDHVITSSMEHNSMMRPLRMLQKNGVDLTIVSCNSQGLLDPDDVAKALKPSTKMVAVNHVSNVTGTIEPIATIGAFCRAHDLLFLVDSAQSAGLQDINMQEDNIDLLAFTGHKSLYGPMGIGGLIIGQRVHIDSFRPLTYGGTGSNSKNEEQPSFLPDKFESGTLNMPGIAGLQAAIQWILHTGIPHIRSHKQKLMNQLFSGLQDISELSYFGIHDHSLQNGLISITLHNHSLSETAALFNDQYSILCRVGLHCSPASHRTINTFPQGTLRFALSYFNTQQDIETVIAAIRQLVRKRGI